MNKKLSLEGESLIKNFEGLRLNAYLDSGGIKTIGWGHALKDDEHHFNKITYEDAEELFKKDIYSLERGLFNLFGRTFLEELEQKKYDSLVSFTYNIGIGNFSKSNVYKNLRKNEHKAALTWWSKWTKDSKGNILQGLIMRRKKEIHTFDHQHIYLSEIEKESLFI